LTYPILDYTFGVDKTTYNLTHITYTTNLFNNEVLQLLNPDLGKIN